jgi:hypothetical protein
MLATLEDRQRGPVCCGFFATFAIFCSNPRLESSAYPPPRQTHNTRLARYLSIWKVPLDSFLGRCNHTLNIRSRSTRRRRNPFTKIRPHPKVGRVSKLARPMPKSGAQRSLRAARTGGPRTSPRLLPGAEAHAGRDGEPLRQFGGEWPDHGPARAVRHGQGPAR